MIKNFTPRLYQEKIFSTCIMKNTLVVLPTGLGKTNIFLMITAQRLKQYPDSKILFIGPTRPLISQYYEVFKNNFEIEEKFMVIFTGQISPKKRQELWQNAKIIFSTPQGIENDLISRRIDLKDVSLLGIDEAHRAVGDYSYVWIAKRYQETANYPKLIGFTASPGSDNEKIKEVCSNLFIEDIESRNNNDPDVKPYIKEIKINKIFIELSEEMKQIKKYLDNCYKSKIDEIKNYGLIQDFDEKNSSKIKLLTLQKELVIEMNSGNRDFSILKSLSLTAEAMKISHASDLLESQGITPLKNYMDRLKKESLTSKVKAVQNLVKDNNFKSALYLVDSLFDKKINHPKMEYLEELIKLQIKKEPTSKIIIFTQFRDTASSIKDYLNNINLINSEIFVGQQKKNGTGLSQKNQIKMLDDFRNNLFNTIIMTSVGEEGLDIPSVDLVIFYEPIPSAIRSIQRRGRTGRQDKGEVIILIAKETKDEAYFWSSHHKEKRMTNSIKNIKKEFSFSTNLIKDNYNKENIKETKEHNQKNLDIFIKEKKEDIHIFADYREKGSNVLKNLIDNDLFISLEKLNIGDYQLSERVVVEYKTKEDFVDSLIDGRLLSQLPELKRNFEKPIIIVEGNQDIYSIRNVHPNSIKGMITTILINFHIPILFTNNPKETADYLLNIAKKEQEEKIKNFSMHGEKRILPTKEQQEYIISSFPNIGNATAKELLKKFKTIKNIVNANEEELKETEKIGKTIAKRIYDLSNEEYK
jgi:ERCC4-related helicase